MKYRKWLSHLGWALNKAPSLTCKDRGTIIFPLCLCFYEFSLPAYPPLPFYASVCVRQMFPDLQPYSCVPSIRFLSLDRPYKRFWRCDIPDRNLARSDNRTSLQCRIILHHPLMFFPKYSFKMARLSSHRTPSVTFGRQKELSNTILEQLQPLLPRMLSSSILLVL